MNQNSSQNSSRPVMLNTGDMLVRFNPSDLAYIKAERVYSSIYLCDGVTLYQVCHPLGHLEEVLKEFGIIRVSRSYMVNIWQVNKIMGSLIYLNGCKTPISITESYNDVPAKCFDIISLTGQK